MPERVEGESGDWRLGIEEGRAEPKPGPKTAPGPARDLSAARLDRPLYVLTAEHLGWFLVLLWTFASRLLDLGGRPMAESEAVRALASFHALDARPLFDAGWVAALQSLIFSSVGAGDSLARIIAALFGILLVGTALLLRHDLGRAGGLALGALLALSPTVTYYSRSDSPLVPALTLMVLGVAMLCAVARSPRRATAITLGAVVALAISAAPAGTFAGAELAVVLAILGIWQALAAEDAAARLGVWWERRRGLFIAGVLVGVALFYALESGLFERPFIAAVTADATRNWISARESGAPGFQPGIAFYMLEFAFYEFFIVAMAAFGTVAMLTFRLRSRLSVAAFLWMAASTAFFLWTPVRRPELAILIPSAMLGASAVDWLHHTSAWRFVRYPILAFVLLTLYVQVLNNFVWTAPDPTEAPWARHALLYWREPATTMTTPEECEHALKTAGPKASVFFDAASPVLRWYLRALRPANDVRGAAVVVSAPTGPNPAGTRESSKFTLQERWSPGMSGLDPLGTLRYIFAARTWKPLQSEDVRLSLRRLPAARVPTVIFAPRAQPSPAEARPSPSLLGVPSPVSTPTTPPASPTPSATPQPTVSPKPSSAAPESQSTLSPAPAPPAPAASATPALEHPTASSGTV